MPQKIFSALLKAIVARINKKSAASIVVACVRCACVGDGLAGKTCRVQAAAIAPTRLSPCGIAARVVTTHWE